MAVRTGLIGCPVAHSRSPGIHRVFAAQLGLEVEYRLIEARAGDFGSEVRAFFAASGRGLNVTLPYKAAALALAAEAGVAAGRCGVANVLRIVSGRLRADNVDGLGLVRDLARLGFDLRGARGLILGAGGAAAGIVPALMEAGMDEITLLNRTPARARALARRLGIERVRALPRSACRGPYQLVVNATSASLAGECPDFPPGAMDRASTLAYDLVYADSPSPFLRRASALGAQAVDGWGMLLEQAAESFFLWHGVRPGTAALHWNRTLACGE